MAFHHYVQKALMKFWSTPLGEVNDWPDLALKKVPWDGFVWCFDFATKKIEERHIKRLYGAEDLNSDEDEERLGRLIDRPLAEFAQFALKCHLLRQPMTVEDPVTLRAVSIVFLIQGARGIEGTNDEKDVVSRLLMATDEELHNVGAHFRNHNQLSTYILPRNYLFSLPEAGWFPFPILDKEVGPAWGYAIPLNPRTALLALPNGVTMNEERDSAALAMFSVGLQPNTRLVLPLDRAPLDEGALVSGLLEQRAQVLKLRDLVQQVRAHVARMREIAGNPPVNTVAGGIS